MGKLQLKIDGKDFTGVLVGNPVIKDQLNACCRTLSFDLSLYGNKVDLLSHKVELFYNGTRWFIGEIKKQKEAHDGKNDLTAYDPLFLFGKHEDDYYFKNQTATQIAKSMANKIGIKVYKLENTKAVIGYMLYKKGAPDKIMVDALARTWNAGGDKFWFRYDPVHDGILLKRRTVPDKIWAFKTGSNLLSASRERSIEEMFNTVKLINRETGKTVTKVNAKNKALYGNTQYYEEINDKDTNLDKYAAVKLASLSKIKSTMSMSGVNSDGSMGQFFVGDPLYVEEKNTGMIGGYWITNVSHTFLADDAIQLDFDLSVTEDIPEIQYDDSKVSTCKGKTTTALHVRSGAGTNHKSKGVWPTGTELIINGKSGNWYEVTGKLKGKEVSGYSHKDYIKITAGTVPK